MATTLYFRPPESIGSIGRWSSGTNFARTHDAVGQGWVYKSLRTSRGSSAVSITRSTSIGPTAGQEIESQDVWVSPPLSADVTIAGTITFNLRMAEGSSAANAGAQVMIQRLDSQGAFGATVVNSEKGTELTPTTETAENWTAAPTSTAFLKGDRILARVLINDGGGTLAVSTETFWYDGPTPAASGDSYITFTEDTIAFYSADPTGTVLYPTDTTAEVDPNGGSFDAKELWTSRGAGTVTSITNTAAGWTAPLQATASAGGNFVEWFTRGLSAVTLGGLVKCQLRWQESNALANVASRAELAVCAADGTSPTVWAASTGNAEADPSSSSEIKFYLAGQDTSVSAGQRLRLRVYIDDTGANAMASTHTATFRYGGASASSGDSLLTFTQTLSEGAGAPTEAIGDAFGMSGFYG